MKRYALYLLPDADTALWGFASGLIGYDSVRGVALAQPALPGISAAELAAATEDPRRYGFHLTLKAPFRLAEGRSAAVLEAELAGYCATRKGFDLGTLTLEARMGADGRGFICLVPKKSCPGVFVLEQEIVRVFDGFRAPLNAAEIARRRPESLTPPQRHLLEAYGYPFVMQEFRPHFSLTGVVDEPQRWREALEAALSALPGPATCAINGIGLFCQPSPKAPFHLAHFARFGRAS